jgi:hypothetical protein
MLRCPGSSDYPRSAQAQSWRMRLRARRQLVQTERTVTAYLVAPRSALGAIGPDARSTELG